ncbi:gamma-aminobutyric acid receptor subunit alpha-1-like [Centruroides vittatus]|uniref:gamma-aminobutyric acid receptor subunit alpha-1-like n=1 Tax=Centruroides vittatus TaxID=120091 RepID=UPI0035100205
MYDTSILLDNLLSERNYNRHVRPGFGGPPTIVHTDIEIRSFGHISEKNMVYSLDCYFRQTWWDKRLTYSNETFTVLSMDWKFLQKVWTPDTFFLNGKGSYLHKVSAPNKFIRIASDGKMQYSMRLTVKASCPMHLRKYPLDIQACPLEIGSFAYTTRDVIYEWKKTKGKAVILADDVTSSQYDFLNISMSNFTIIGPAGGLSSALKVRFMLRRRRGYFILQIYAPSAMIVGASWVSFWINPTDAAGRVAVGAMTVLTLVTMGFGGKSALPRVAYATAMDWFVVMCFTFVFAAMVEYACVNLTDRYYTRKANKANASKSVENDEEAENKEKESDKDIKEEETIELNIEEEEKETRHVLLPKWKKRKKSKKRKIENYRVIPQSVIQSPSTAAYRIDRYARIAFPSFFTFFNVIYWTLYLHFIDDQIEDD